jgi:predicted DNA-binding transcriptional regulator AlpA
MSKQEESTIGWPTKLEVAQALGVSTKTVEKYVAEGKLKQAMQSQINKPARAVIDPATLERLKEERSTLAPSFANQVGNRSRAILNDGPDRWISMIKQALLPPEQNRWLTVDEAAEYTKLTRSTLLRLIREGKLPAVEDVPSKSNGEKVARPGSKYRLNRKVLDAFEGVAVSPDPENSSVLKAGAK